MSLFPAVGPDVAGLRIVFLIIGLVPMAYTIIKGSNLFLAVHGICVLLNSYLKRIHRFSLLPTYLVNWKLCDTCKLLHVFVCLSLVITFKTVNRKQNLIWCDFLLDRCWSKCWNFPTVYLLGAFLLRLISADWRLETGLVFWIPPISKWNLFYEFF